MMKKFLSLLLVVIMCFTPLLSVEVYAIDADYENWKQWDSRWTNIQLGNGTKTRMGKIGCRVTAIAIVCAKLDLVDNSFTPGTFATALKKLGGFTSSGAMNNWTDPEKLVTGLDMVKKVSLEGMTQAEKAKIIAQYTTNGYACTICVKSGGHYVAADSVSGNIVYINDPGYNGRTKLFDHYANNGITSIRVFKRTDGGLGNTGTTGNTSTPVTPETPKAPVTTEPPKTPATPAASTLRIELTQYPAAIKQGNLFSVRGTISSNYIITSVKGTITDANGTVVQSTTDTPNATTMDVRSANLNQKLIFERLAAGQYMLQIIAQDESGQRKTWRGSFQVEAEPKTEKPETTEPTTTQTIANGVYVISSMLDETYVLDIEGAGTSNGDNLQLWEKNGTAAQTFSVKHEGNDYYRIVNTNSGKALEVNDEWNVWQNTVGNADSQLWKIVSAQNGSYYIISKSSELYLDVDNADANSGTNVKVFEQNEAYNAQKWFFEKQ